MKSAYLLLAFISTVLTQSQITISQDFNPPIYLETHQQIIKDAIKLLETIDQLKKKIKDPYAKMDLILIENELLEEVNNKIIEVNATGKYKIKTLTNKPSFHLANLNQPR